MENPIMNQSLSTEAGQTSHQESVRCLGIMGGQDKLSTTSEPTMQMPQQEKPKLSGAQRRKLAIARALELGEPIHSKKRRSNRRPGDKTFRRRERANFFKQPSFARGFWRSRSGDIRYVPRHSTMSRFVAEGTVQPTASNRPDKRDYKEMSILASPSTSTGVPYNEKVVLTKVAIVLSNYPAAKLTEKQASILQTIILQKVWACDPGTGPHFKNSYTDKGALFITCADQRSLRWLMELVPELHPWEGAYLRVCYPDDLIQTFKVVVWVPTKLFGIMVPEPSQIVALFEAQNKGLSTKDWSIVSSESDLNGTMLVLRIDERSLDTLEARDYEAYLGLAQVTFRVPSRITTPPPRYNRYSRM